jgi:hypothetical protein
VVGDTTTSVWSANPETAGNAVFAEATGVTAFLANVLPDVVGGSVDTVEVELSTVIVTAGTGIFVSLFHQEVDYGVAKAFGSATRITGSGLFVPASTTWPLVLKGIYDVGAIANGKFVAFFLGAQATGAGHTYTLTGEHEIIAKVHRVSTIGT